MDKFPKTLVCLLNSVIEEYKEFSWASQEYNGKMRITLTWTNSEVKRTKSKATRKRDHNRLEQYIEKQNVVSETTNMTDNHVKITSDNKLDLSDNSESESEMEIVDSKIIPCGTSLQVNKENGSIINRKDSPVVDKQVNDKVKTDVNIDKPIDKGVNVERTDTQVNSIELRRRQCMIKRRAIADENKINERKTAECTIKDVNSEKQNESDELPKWPARRYFEKIVMKTTSCCPNTLIGKLPGKNYVVVHKISENVTEMMSPQDWDYKYLEKNVSVDFRDVQETDYMNENVVMAIRKMEDWVEKHGLHRF